MLAERSNYKDLIKRTERSVRNTADLHQDGNFRTTQPEQGLNLNLDLERNRIDTFRFVETIVVIHTSRQQGQATGLFDS